MTAKRNLINCHEDSSWAVLWAKKIILFLWKVINFHENSCWAALVFRNFTNNVSLDLGLRITDSRNSRLTNKFQYLHSQNTEVTLKKTFWGNKKSFARFKRGDKNFCIICAKSKDWSYFQVQKCSVVVLQMTLLVRLVQNVLWKYIIGFHFSNWWITNSKPTVSCLFDGISGNS